MTNRPIDRSMFIGSSEHFSLDEAVRDALAQATPPGASDMQVDFQINRIFGQSGGISGLNNLFVEIKLDADIAQDVPTGSGDQAPIANAVALVDPTIEGLEITCLESRPPQFVLRGRRTMPTPGWSFHIDSVKVEHKAKRISLRITDVPPDGATIQVPGPSPIAVQLGTLRHGRYLVELHARRSPSEKHRLLQAAVIEAS